jgi:hypothetical protein
VALLAGIAAPHGASAVTLGQVDDFEDGTTQGWVVALQGANPPAATLPTNISSGGPAGANDNYLQLTSLGNYGPGGKLIAINVSQWTGDYIAANVLGISASVINLGATDVSLRFFFSDADGAPPSNAAISSQAIVLPSGSGWTNVVFPISASDLTATVGSVEAALANARDVRILHALTAAFPGENKNAQIGVDNLTAVPEPGTGLLLGLGLVALGARRTRA